MSTRCNIHFVAEKHTVANIYRHSDGYPGKGGIEEDLQVWQAGEYARNPKRPLDFLSLGVQAADSPDIEYVWTVDCSRMDEKTGFPTVSHRRA